MMYVYNNLCEDMFIHVRVKSWQNKNLSKQRNIYVSRVQYKALKNSLKSCHMTSGMACMLNSPLYKTYLYLKPGIKIWRKKTQNILFSREDWVNIDCVFYFNIDLVISRMTQCC